MLSYSYSAQAAARRLAQARSSWDIGDGLPDALTDKLSLYHSIFAPGMERRPVPTLRITTKPVIEPAAFQYLFPWRQSQLDILIYSSLSPPVSPMACPSHALHAVLYVGASRIC
jgi:hypothetical protein